MQDRFLMRVYDPVTKRMIYDMALIYTQLKYIVQGFSLENLKLMQCTGLKDKNGKLIYEGDIVKLTEDENIYNIIFEEDKARFLISSKTFDFMFSSHLIKDIEVIGNIYKTPESLAKEGKNAN